MLKQNSKQKSVSQPKLLLLFSTSILHNSSSKRVLPQYSPYSLFRMKHVCAAALFHVCARAAVYSSLFAPGPPRSCIGKQTAHGARLGPQGGGGWTRIRPEVAVAAKEYINVKAKQRQSYRQHCTIWKAAKQQTKVCQPKLLLFNASISHNSSSKRVLPQYSPYSLLA